MPDGADYLAEFASAIGCPELPLLGESFEDFGGTMLLKSLERTGLDLYDSQLSGTPGETTVYVELHARGMGYCCVAYSSTTLIVYSPLSGVIDDCVLFTRQTCPWIASISTGLPRA